MEALPDDSKVLAKPYLQEEFRKMHNKLQTSQKETVPATFNEETNPSESKINSKSVWGWLESIPIQGIVPTTEDTETENVINQFVSLRRIARSESPLQWWKHNSSQLPVLSEIAKCFLAIPARKYQKRSTTAYPCRRTNSSS
ncbi:hypothetical protein PR048_019703 [Dryococelus australis]|uniref:HAT C-terminal dimerisation domain-containing protein n=1 Tax=Dryococelus australis TaxID=614101 RepID=A0ABQ9H497_9NEOP|nr:hypothetical protein PR048_019703 [Dryococelus australis]